MTPNNRGKLCVRNGKVRYYRRRFEEPRDFRVHFVVKFHVFRLFTCTKCVREASDYSNCGKVSVVLLLLVSSTLLLSKLIN